MTGIAKVTEILNEIRDGIFMTDQRGVITFVNEPLAEMHGLGGAEKMIGKHFSEFVSPEFRSEISDKFKKAVEEESYSEVLEFSIMRRDGGLIFIQLKHGPVVENGRIVGTVGVIRDVTDKKRAEGALAASEKKYRTIVENMSDVVFIVDRTGTLLFITPSATRMIGYEPSEIIGHNMQEFIYEEDYNSALKNLRLVFSEKGIISNEYRIRHKNGRIIWMQTFTRALLEGDDVVAVQGSFFDITERKGMEEELRRSRDELELRIKERTTELERTNKELQLEIEKRKAYGADLKLQGEKLIRAYNQRDYLSRRLVDLVEKERREVGSALHEEIGQIMAGVILHMEKLKTVGYEDGFGLQEQVTAIQEMLGEAVKQVRNISRNLRSETLERYGLIPAIRELMENIKRGYDIQVHFFTKNVPQDLGEDGKDLVIYRVIQEGLTNAVKYAQAEEIFINLIERDRLLLLTIEDYGAGFDYDSVSKKTATRGGPLGLTIMRERVSQVGGQFRVESTPGKGTQIFVEIPSG
ncbi:MAG: PAS domain S-box protein [Deltaproteobacteria bacterium]|jgi:PAS domain S-box-containing protein